VFRFIFRPLKFLVHGRLTRRGAAESSLISFETPPPALAGVRSMVCLEVGTVSAGEYFLRGNRRLGCRDLFVGLPGGDLPAAKFFTSGAAHHQVLHPVMAPCTQGGVPGPWIPFAPGARRRTGYRAAAVPLYRRGIGQHAAHPYDEHHQRRIACRQLHRLPGIHDHAGGSNLICRGDPNGRRGVP